MWDNSPTKRPSALEIVETLDNLRFQYVLKDPEIIQFWCNSFGATVDHISFSTFLKHIKTKFTDIDKTDERMLSMLFLKAGNMVGTVNLDRFGKLCSLIRFQSFISEMRKLVRSEWFFGDHSINGTLNLLAGEKNGTYIVRFAITRDGMYIINFLDDHGNLEEIQIIVRINNGKLWYEVGGKEFDSIDAVIGKYSNVLKYICSQSPFKTFRKPIPTCNKELILYLRIS